jgi:hypothetical protein
MTKRVTEEKKAEQPARRYGVSIRGATHARLKAEAEQRGCTIAALLEEILAAAPLEKK